MGLPIYITVAIIVAAAVIAVLSISIYGILADSQLYQVEHEMDKIASEAENMFEYADGGTMITVHIEFPASMKFVVFGGLPTNGSSEPDNLTLDEKTSNNYYLVMVDGTVQTYHSNVRFSSEDYNKIAIFTSGIYDLTLELEKIDSRTYVKIY
ncbi:MAG: hypothetical protein U9R21_08245 [Candidatus Thermoplasmatota archaeon]|nr:hypothetical protein [Candidatus Thermoplasmatota archaeon]